MDSDLIASVLQTTGLSCDDLLLKLQQYQSQQSRTTEENNVPVATEKSNTSIKVEENNVTNDETDVKPEGTSKKETCDGNERTQLLRPNVVPLKDDTNEERILDSQTSEDSNLKTLHSPTNQSVISPKVKNILDNENKSLPTENTTSVKEDEQSRTDLADSINEENSRNASNRQHNPFTQLFKSECDPKTHTYQLIDNATVQTSSTNEEKIVKDVTELATIDEEISCNAVSPEHPEIFVRDSNTTTAESALDNKDEKIFSDKLKEMKTPAVELHDQSENSATIDEETNKSMMQESRIQISESEHTREKCHTEKCLAKEDGTSDKEEAVEETFSYKKECENLSVHQDHNLVENDCNNIVKETHTTSGNSLTKCNTRHLEEASSSQDRVKTESHTKNVVKNENAAENDEDILLASNCNRTVNDTLAVEDQNKFCNNLTTDCSNTNPKNVLDERDVDSRDQKHTQEQPVDLMESEKISTEINVDASSNKQNIKEEEVKVTAYSASVKDALNTKDEIETSYFTENLLEKVSSTEVDHSLEQKEVSTIDEKNVKDDVQNTVDSEEKYVPDKFMTEEHIVCADLLRSKNEDSFSSAIDEVGDLMTCEENFAGITVEIESNMTKDVDKMSINNFVDAEDELHKTATNAEDSSHKASATSTMIDHKVEGADNCVSSDLHHNDQERKPTESNAFTVVEDKLTTGDVCPAIGKKCFEKIKHTPLIEKTEVNNSLQECDNTMNVQDDPTKKSEFNNQKEKCGALEDSEMHTSSEKSSPNKQPNQLNITSLCSVQTKPNNQMIGEFESFLNKKRTSQAEDIISYRRKRRPMSISSILLNKLTENDKSFENLENLLGPTEELKANSDWESKIPAQIIENCNKDVTEDLVHDTQGNIDVKPVDQNAMTDHDYTRLNAEEAGPSTSQGQDLHDILKMQLSSLRNMKKSSTILPDMKRSSLIFLTVKRKRKSRDVKSTLIENAQNRQEEDNGSLVSSNQTAFMITDVSGGIDRLGTTSEDDKEKEILANKEDRQSESPNSNTASVKVKEHLCQSFGQDPGVAKSAKNSQKSPFISDSLDDFLNDSAQLKISYAIPKLGAEEGICENAKQSPFDSVVNTQVKVGQETTPKDKTKIVKAKTLAEMRRNYEKLQLKQRKLKAKQAKAKGEEPKINEESNSLNISSRYKRKWHKERSKNSNWRVRNVGVQDSKFVCKIDHSHQRNSFVLCDEKKIWLPSKQRGQKCLGVINTNIAKEKQENKAPVAIVKTPSSRKQSLLSALRENKTIRTKYKPGPLCKKPNLQLCTDRWSTELKKLPQIYLEVVPEISKPIDTSIVHLLPIFDGVVIDEKRIEFALSVLKPKNTNIEPESFKYRIPYKNNQEYLLVKKRKPTPVVPSVVEAFENDPRNDVANIIDDIITYVETKEIAPTLIKEDDIVVEPEPVIEASKTNKAQRIKRNKLEHELQRLSCKVINVATDEVEDCSKSHCKFGCVCKSLLCDSVFSDHCQLVKCMFGCKCPPVTNVRMTNNSLSAQTLNHLEDKAKRNMAKVEREFTQTLIRTGNDQILVNTKSRRSSKPPKKYTDFVADTEANDDDVSKIIRNTPAGCKPCDVPLEKLELNDVLPLCIVHCRYNCQCNDEKQESLSKPTTSKTCASPQKQALIQRSSERIPKLKLVKTDDNEYVKLYDNCARVRQVWPEYKRRNKEPIYNAKLRTKHMTGFEFDEVSEIDYNFDDCNITICHDEPELQKTSRKRKQSFNVREETPVVTSRKQFAVQRRKKKPRLIRPKFDHVFEGEIKVCLKENQEFLNLIGSEHAAMEYLRILPWGKFVESFKSHKLRVWAKEKRPAVMLCNSIGHLPPPNFVDITKIERKTEFIKWILTDTLPPNMPRNLLHLMLTPKGINFLIAGYCLKKIEEKSSAPDSEPPVDPVANPLSAEGSNTFDDFYEDSTASIEINAHYRADDSEETNSHLFPGANEKTENEVATIQQSKIVHKVVERQFEMTKTDLETSTVLPSSSGKPSLDQDVKKSSAKSVKSKSSKNVDNSDESSELLEQQIKSALASLERDVSERATPTANLTSNNEDLDIINIDDAESSQKQVPVSIKPKRKIIIRGRSNMLLNSYSSRLTTEPCLIPSRSLKCTHKDMYNRSKALVLTNKVFNKRRVYCERKDANTELIVPLPQVSRNLRWRMVYLNSDFAFLTFSKISYSIKYTDLMDVVKMSTNIRSTITLQNKEFGVEYKHPLFGIYCVPDFQDRLFIGPFLSSESPSVETLRYLQGKLVDTLVFNKMVGRSNEKAPTWVYETPQQPVRLPNGLVIDITEEEDVVNLDSDEDAQANIDFQSLTSSLLISPFVEELTPEQLKSRQNVNRYIVTNIPHLGYLDAYQREDKAIDVFWPSKMNMGFRFPNVTFAKNVLTLYFSQIFCSIPREFKINVIVMTSIASCKTLNTKYLTGTGPYFCGEFGVYAKDAVPDSLLKKYNITSLDSLVKSHRELQEHEEGLIRIFGLFLMSNEELKKSHDAQDILPWARSEIYILKKLGENYESEKADLQNIIRINSQKFKELRRTRRNETRTSSCVLQSETIEIEDSDEENAQQTEGDANPVFKRICTSGKVDTSIFSSNDRSILKTNVWRKKGISLLKTKEVEGQKGSDKSPAHTINVEIAMNNSNITLEKDKTLITKLK